MVEGPGCTRNGRKVQLAVGKAFIDAPSAAAPTLPRHSIIAGGELTANHSRLLEAFTVGKELFLIFAANTDDDVALRLHFGMNGSLIARKVKASDLQKPPSGIAPWKQGKEPSLRLYFMDNSGGGHFPGSTSNNTSYIVIEAWDTTVNYPVSASKSRNKMIELTSRDVCSSLFNAQNVFTAIRELGNNMIISDALLNQDICPGVGNIIKIESLHRSMIDPRRIVSSLTDPELRRVIKQARLYSMDWLKSGRAGTKHVYNQTTCGTCRGTTVKMQKIGGGSSADDNSNDRGKGHAFMSRVTFWCTVCQPSNASVTIVTRETNATIPTQNVIETLSRPQMQCPQHGTKSLKLCRVRKDSPNYLRLFLSCNSKACQYFAWVDSEFPNCRCMKKAILRVAKTERSGGRWFMCCATGDKSLKGNSINGCGYFEWATDDHLAPFHSLLTPLL
jgi:formamidopyrimidine-DNA glycosylase